MPRGEQYGTSGAEEECLSGADAVEVRSRIRSSREPPDEDLGKLAAPAAVANPSLFHQGEGDAAGGACGTSAQAFPTTADAPEGPCPPTSLAESYLSREIKELQDVHRFGGGPLVRKRMQHAFRTGAFYDGQWLGNQRDGLGTQTWPDGAKYEGEWRNNKATGRGRFTHGDGDEYIGDWRNNLGHGSGIYVHREGTTYRGEFENDLQHGLGVESWPDQAKFVGIFRAGKKTGQGIYEWPDGSEYAGQWYDNQINGLGTYRGADGRHFAGRWQASSMHGCGRYKWIDGKCYDGQYSRDQKDGFGIFTWADGRRYEGYWARGHQDGLGRLRSAAGEARLARWVAGERIQWIDPEPDSPSSPKAQVAAAPCPASDADCVVSQPLQRVTEVRETCNDSKDGEAEIQEAEAGAGAPDWAHYEDGYLNGKEDF